MSDRTIFVGVMVVLLISVVGLYNAPQPAALMASSETATLGSLTPATTQTADPDREAMLLSVCRTDPNRLRYSGPNPNKTWQRVEFTDCGESLGFWENGPNGEFVHAFGEGVCAKLKSLRIVSDPHCRGKAPEEYAAYLKVAKETRVNRYR